MRRPIRLAVLGAGSWGTTVASLAVRDCDVLVVGVPSHSFRATLQSVVPLLRPWVPVVSLAEGLGVGENTRAMVITRGLAEITRLGVALGGQAVTFAGLTGLGDLLATCMSPLSRNRQVGEQFARGRQTAEIVASMNMVAEGIKTSAVVMELADALKVDMPIAAEVAAVVRGERGAVQAFRGLRRLAAGDESSAG